MIIAAPESVNLTLLRSPPGKNSARMNMTPENASPNLIPTEEKYRELFDAVFDDFVVYYMDDKTAEDYDSIDAISGATLTTDGYKKAILRAFETVKILEGGTSNE